MGSAVQIAEPGVTVLPPRAARGVRVPRTTAEEKAQAAAIVALHAPAHEAAKRTKAPTPRSTPKRNTTPAPRSAPGGSLFQTNSKVQAALIAAGFKLKTRDGASATWTHDDGRAVKATTDANWAVKGGASGKSGKALAEVLK